MSVWPEDLLYTPASYISNIGRLDKNNVQIDILQDVFSAISGYAVSGPQNGVIWRGQASDEWRVESKLGRAAASQFPSASMSERQKIWVDHESRMLDAVRVIGPDGSHHQGDLELLARLRHNGAATRLVDFTQDPMVALWFACNVDDTPDSDEHDGVIAAATRTWFSPVEKPWDTAYLGALNEEEPRLFSLPSIDPRMTAQRGLFAFISTPLSKEEAPVSELGNAKYGDWTQRSQRVLEKICSRTTSWSTLPGRNAKYFPQMIGIFLPKEIKPRLRALLRQTYGLTRNTMYPDFSGLGDAFGSISTEVQ